GQVAGGQPQVIGHGDRHRPGRAVGDPVEERGAGGREARVPGLHGAAVAAEGRYGGGGPGGGRKAGEVGLDLGHEGGAFLGEGERPPGQDSGVHGGPSHFWVPLTTCTPDRVVPSMTGARKVWAR